jgi:hypothetical protein
MTLNKLSRFVERFESSSTPHFLRRIIMKEDKKKKDESKTKCQFEDCEKEGTQVYMDGYLNVFRYCPEHFVEVMKEVIF